MERVFNYIKVMNRVCDVCSYGCSLEIENIIESKEEVRDNLNILFRDMKQYLIADGIKPSDYYFNIVESIMWKQQTAKEKELVKDNLLKRCSTYNVEIPDILTMLEKAIQYIGIGDLWAGYSILTAEIKDYQSFIYKIEELTTIKEKNENEDQCLNMPTLHWGGQKNVLADIFRQSKNKGYITNSLPEIAQFLKSGFDCFANTQLSTIEGMLKNNSSSANAIPKEEKRIQVE